MSRKFWKHRIRDIIDSIKKIQRYVQPMEFEDFQSDEKTIDAVIRNFIVIGEAARHSFALDGLILETGLKKL